MDANELCPSKHITSAELYGKEMIVTIKGVDFHELGEGDTKETKPVLFFEEFPQGMVLNVTKRRVLGALFGREVDEWIGKRITIYPGRTSYQGEQVACIYIKEALPETETQTPP